MQDNGNLSSLLCLLLGVLSTGFTALSTEYTHRTAFSSERSRHHHIAKAEICGWGGACGQKALKTRGAERAYSGLISR